MELSSLKSNRIASLLGLTLVVLTVLVGSSGYFTYKNLNRIVIKLETDNQPNNNLLLYKEVMSGLTGMENQVDFYKLTGEEHYLDKYNEYIENISIFLDSINKINQNDVNLLAFNDSLTHLIDKKTDILNNFLELTSDIAKSDYSRLEKKLAKIPEIVQNDPPQLRNPASGTTVKTDSAIAQENTKQGWLKKLFSKKKEPNKNEEETITEEEKLAQLESKHRRKDSLLTVKAWRYKAELSTEIKRIQTDAEKALQEMKIKQMELETAHSNIQYKIMSLVSFLESRETIKLELNTLNAKELTSKTNNQILIFTILGTLLLLTSLVILLTYYNKSVKYQELLQEAKKSTEILVKAKEKFFANMSHELRTPMNAISGFTKILLRSELSVDQQEHLNIISKSSEHLLKLLNDILDFSKLQAHKLQLESIPFNVKETCEETLKLLKDSARQKGLEIKSEIDEIPSLTQGDPHRLRQILLNLLTNSIKYTDNGEVKLSVSGKTQKEHVLLTFSVSDTGIGIPKDQQLRLFREFEQANQSTFSKGTGLGLAITKRIVLLHQKGKIELKSAEGKGTTVSFSLQYPIAEPLPASQTKKENLKARLSDLKVLIADDEPFNIKLLATLLDNENIQYEIATDGEETLNMLNQKKFDVALLDLKMPKISGWKIVDRIRSESGPNKDQPFIALTATVSKADEKKSLDSGFNYLMRKPFDEKELFSLIAKLTNRKPVPPDEETKQHAVTSPKRTVDLSSLFQMGDKTFVEEMIETFIVSAEAGMMNMEQSLTSKDYDQLADFAHRIVAPARHFKAHELVKTLKELEHLADQKNPSLDQRYLENTKAELTKTCLALRDSLREELVKRS